MWDWINKVSELKNNNESFVITTVIKSFGSTPGELGSKMIITKSNEIFGTIGGGHLEESVVREAGNVKSTFCKDFSLSDIEDHLCGGKVTILFEPVGKLPDVYIYGAGHVGQALCQVLLETPFNIHLIDDRKCWINHKNLSDQIIKHEVSYSDFICSKDSFAIIVTPSHLKDEEVLEKILPLRMKLIGMIGSKRKWNEIKNHLIQKGFNQSDFDKVSCPVGIHKAGKSPKEIAVSIAAQIFDINYEKC